VIDDFLINSINNKNYDLTFCVNLSDKWEMNRKNFKINFQRNKIHLPLDLCMMINDLTNDLEEIRTHRNSLLRVVSSMQNQIPHNNDSITTIQNQTRECYSRITQRLLKLENKFRVYLRNGS
jgi:hypothetical protein